MMKNTSKLSDASCCQAAEETQETQARAANNDESPIE